MSDPSFIDNQRQLRRPVITIHGSPGSQSGLVAVRQTLPLSAMWRSCIPRAQATLVDDDAGAELKAAGVDW